VSNQEICESLSISKATLRTHLNNIYRKCRDLGEEPKFVPANRRQLYRLGSRSKDGLPSTVNRHVGEKPADP